MLINLINGLSGIFYAKDQHSKYLNVTKDVADLVGWKSAENCYGKSDYDLPCKAVESAAEFVKHDHMVILSKQKMQTLEVQQYSSKWSVLLCERSPLIGENNECQGIFGHAMDISDTVFFKAYMSLHSFDNKLYDEKMRARTYLLSSGFQEFSLTKKQENCLFLLIRGKSQKEIAKILSLSPRTIESHFDSIKSNLRCSNKAEIIEKAINLGFLYYIPEFFQKYNHPHSFTQLFE